MPFLLRVTFWQAVSLLSQQLRAMFSVTKTVQYTVHPALYGTSETARVIVMDAQGMLWITSCPYARAEEMIRAISSGSELTAPRQRTVLKESSAEA